MKQYYVATGEGEQGPMDENVLKMAYQQGMYPPDAQVWAEGMAEWVTIQSVFGAKKKKAVKPAAPLAGKPVPGRATTTGAKSKVTGATLQTALTAPPSSTPKKKKKTWVIWVTLAVLLLAAGLVYWFCLRTPGIDSDEGLTKFVDDRMNKVLKNEVYEKIDKDSKIKRNVLEHWENLSDSLKSADSNHKGGTIYLLTAMGNEKALKYVLTKPAFRRYWEEDKQRFAEMVAHVAGVTGNRKIISFLTDEMNIPMMDLLPGLKTGVLAGGQKEYCAELIKEHNIKYSTNDLRPLLTTNQDGTNAAALRVLKDPSSTVSKNDCRKGIEETLQLILTGNHIEGKRLDKSEFEMHLKHCQNEKIVKAFEDYFKKHK